MDAWRSLVSDPETRHVARTTRKHLCSALFAETKAKHLIVFDAPVKSGKLKVIVSMMTWTRAFCPERRVRHYVVTAWNRVSEAGQRDELRAAHAKVYVMNQSETAEKAAKSILRKLERGRPVVIHHDELDYGSGAEQKMDEFYSLLPLDHPLLHRVYYSATCEELLLSKSFKDWPEEDKLYYKYTPDAAYRGAAYFLDSGLHVEAAPPFYMGNELRPSPQLKQVFADGIAHVKSGTDKERNVLVVRVHSHTFQALKAAVEQKAPSLGVLSSERVHHLWSHSVHGTCNVQWDDAATFDNYPQDRLLVVWVDQECGRATLWRIHQKVFAYHNYSAPSTPYNTTIQQAMRVAHYVGTRYKAAQPIRLYCRGADLQLAAGRLDLVKYHGNLSSRMNARRVKGTTAYLPPILSKMDVDVAHLNTRRTNDRNAFAELVRECTPKFPKGKVCAIRRFQKGNDPQSSIWHHLPAVWAAVQHNLTASKDKKIAPGPCGTPSKTDESQDGIYMDVVLNSFPLPNGQSIPAGTVIIHKRVPLDEDAASVTRFSFHYTDETSMFS
jgi:hypothetical protein